MNPNFFFDVTDYNHLVEENDIDKYSSKLKNYLIYEQTFKIRKLTYDENKDKLEEKIKSFHEHRIKMAEIGFGICSMYVEKKNEKQVIGVIEKQLDELKNEIITFSDDIQNTCNLDTNGFTLNFENDLKLLKKEFLDNSDEIETRTIDENNFNSEMKRKRGRPKNSEVAVKKSIDLSTCTTSCTFDFKTVKKFKFKK